MSIRIEKAIADQGQYGYCSACGGLVHAHFPGPVTLRATSIIEPKTLVTLPEFCVCQETEDAQIMRMLLETSRHQ